MPILGILASSFDNTVAARGLFGGGGGPSNVIDYIDIATTGNATDFGDLTLSRGFLGASSSLIRGVFSGGYASANPNNTMDYVTIASTGNATDFGDLTVARYVGATFSNCHGGLA